MGCIGVGYMGKLNTFGFNQMRDVCDIAAICDVDSKYGLESTLANKELGTKRDDTITPPDAYKEYQRILDRKDIDAVCISTVDHWHTKIAIEALQAGKHVFCEKPLTLTLEENQLIRKACKKYPNLVFGVDTWQRSRKDLFMTAVLMVQHGFLGKLTNIVCNLGPGLTSEPVPEAPVPDSLDWNLWQGPVPTTAYRHNFIESHGKQVEQTRAHDKFRWWYEYSGGKFTDWGAHNIDIALWALGLQTRGTGPVSIDGTHTTHPVPFKDGYPTVNDRYNTCVDFDIPVAFDDGFVMHVVSSSSDGNGGILFEGEKGKIHVNRMRIKGKPYEELPPNTFKEEEYIKLYGGKPVEGHKYNFTRCIRQGGLPASDVETHLLTMNVCHVCAIAARLGRKVQWDPKTESIVGDEQAATFATRERRKEFEIHV
ncbi:MAG: Gfo/Idh/MocA family oxidoreductase [Planctomycetia bacterium]|nr:Gfo/Idh/MocA family oxidoreductase [Planctomycetia bacterium]